MGGALSGKSKPQTASGVETKDAKPEAQPEAQPKAQPEAQPEAQPKAQPEAQPEAPPEVQPVGDLEDKPTDASDLNKDVEKEVRTIIILFGPPGSGKGTHAPTIVAALDTPQPTSNDVSFSVLTRVSVVSRPVRTIESVLKSRETSTRVFELSRSSLTRHQSTTTLCQNSSRNSVNRYCY